MKFEDVIDMMLTLLDDYQIANITDEELKLETSIKVNMVISRTSFEELTFDIDHSKNINGEELFMKAYKISRNFSFNYSNLRFHVILNLKGLEKHFIYYLIDLFK